MTESELQSLLAEIDEVWTACRCDTTREKLAAAGAAVKRVLEPEDEDEDDDFYEDGPSIRLLPEYGDDPEAHDEASGSIADEMIVCDARIALLGARADMTEDDALADTYIDAMNEQIDQYNLLVKEFGSRIELVLKSALDQMKQAEQ